MKLEIANDWYENFFSGINCELWEKAVSAEWTAKEVAFLLDMLNVQAGEKLLDIPCGFGRHAVELAKKGFDMTGIDISTQFLEKLRATIATEQLSIRVIEGNLLTTAFPGPFDGAYCMGNSFGYFTYDKMHVFVEKVAATLKPGARFILNTGIVAESILPNYAPNKTYVLDDLTMEINNSYEVDNSCLLTEASYTKGGRTEVHHFKHFVYTLAEIKRLFALYKLKTIAVYSSTDKAGYQMGDQQMYLVAEKIG